MEIAATRGPSGAGDGVDDEPVRLRDHGRGRTAASLKGDLVPILFLRPAREREHQEQTHK